MKEIERLCSSIDWIVLLCLKTTSCFFLVLPKIESKERLMFRWLSPSMLVWTYLVLIVALSMIPLLAIGIFLIYVVYALECDALEEILC